MRLQAAINARPMAWSDQVFVCGGRGDRLALRPYVPGDEARLTLRADFRHALDCAGGELPAGVRWTLMASRHGEETPIAVGGLEPIDRHVFGAWALCSDMTPRQWAFARRCAARVLAWSERELYARRIEAMAKADLKAVALLRRLGFARTGKRARGPDQRPYIHMAREF